MKKIFLIIVCICSCLCLQSQILKSDEDVDNDEFSFDILNELDARMAVQLAERKLKTLLTGTANTALAAVPFIGTEGVQSELLGTNLRMDELITLNKNYNFKLTSALGNILKITKEARDGTIATRAANLAGKVKVVKQSVEVIERVEKLKKNYEILQQNGWKSSDMIRAVVQLDVLMKKTEELTKTLLEAWKNANHQEQKEKLEKTQEKLKELDNYVLEQNNQLDDIINEIYTNKLNDNLNRAYFDGIYNFKYTKDEAQEKFETTLNESHNTIIAFRNFYWYLVGIIAFIAAIGYVFKLYTEKDNMISAHIIYWALTLAITAFLGILLELIKT